MTLIEQLKKYQRGIIPGASYSQAQVFQLIFAALIELLERKQNG